MILTWIQLIFIPFKKAIASLNWNEKKYLDTKKALINKLGDIKTRQRLTI